MPRSEWRIDDRYELLDELAAGGAGTVWRCRDVRSGAEHTVTLLRPRPNRQDAALEAIVPVLNAIEQLAHPQIVVADEVVAGEDWIAVIAQPIPADDLHSLLRQHGPMPTVQAAHLGAQLCEILAAAHDIGVPHGLLIPTAVRFEPGEGGPWTVRLNGFGMAGLVPFVVPPDADTPIRRALYRAPELADDASESAAADVYAVGVLLYEALTGHPPFTGVDPAEIAAQHRLVRPTPIPAPVQVSAPGAAETHVSAQVQADHPLWPFIAACLEKNPHDRPAAALLAEQFAELPAPAPAALPAVLPVVAAHRHTAPKPGRLVRLKRSRLVEIGAAVAVGVLTAVSITLLVAGGGGRHSGTVAGNVNPIVPIATGAQAFTQTPTATPSAALDPSPTPSRGVTASASRATSTGTTGASSPATPSASSSAPYTGGSGVSGRLVNARSGLCLDTSGGYYANGVVPQVWTCNSGANQIVTWAVSGQLTEDGGAYCLEDTGGSAAAGTKVELFTCRAGTDQQWSVRSNGSISNRKTGLCIDVAAPSTETGDQIVLESCDGQASQQWAWN